MPRSKVLEHGKTIRIEFGPSEYLEIQQLKKGRFRIRSSPDYITIIPDCGNQIYLEIRRPEEV